MKAINKVIAKSFHHDTRLGYPHPDGTSGIYRRLNYFATLRGGKGFREPQTSRIGARMKRGSISHPLNKRG